MRALIREALPIQRRKIRFRRAKGRRRNAEFMVTLLLGLGAVSYTHLTLPTTERV